MNEKIKRLLRQIKGETYSPLGLSTIYGTSKLYDMTEEEITQFAELIIQECCSICLDPNNWYEDAAGETFSALIKQKFGVE